MENLKFVTDVEGPVTNPGFDFAWLTLDSLSHHLKEKYYEKIKRFDEADDGIWLNERNEQGWSTGTTPIISQCLAACDGKTDDDLLAITKQKIVENKGIDEVIKFLKEEDIEQYFVTSSYPAVSLLLGYKYDIPSSHIHCSGHQLSGIEKVYFDSNRDLEKELRKRSPISILRKDPEELETFLDKFMDNSYEIYTAYLKGDKQQIKDLKKEQLSILFHEINNDEVMHEMYYLLLKQNGVMGGHKKKRALESISPNREVIYIGDGIVDADALNYAKCGISVNCTNKYALAASDMNLATNDFSVLIPIFSDINNNYGRLSDFEKLKREVKAYGGILFSRDDIQTNFNKVRETNKEFKTELKEEYERIA